MSVKISVPWAIAMFISIFAIMWGAWEMFANNAYGVPITALIVVPGGIIFILSLIFIRSRGTKGKAIIATGSDSKEQVKSGNAPKVGEYSGTVKPVDFDQSFADFHFDEEFAKVTGAQSVETEAPDFNKYYDEESIYDRNERLKKQFYAESAGISAPGNLTGGKRESALPHQSANSPSNPAPVLPYEPTDADYARLRGLLTGRAPPVPLGATKGESGSGATPLRANAQAVGRPTEAKGVTVSPIPSDHRPAAHPSDMDEMVFNQPRVDTPFGARFWDQFYEDDFTPPILKLKFMSKPEVLAFNMLRKKYLDSLNKKPGVSVLGVNIKVKKSEAKPASPASKHAPIESVGDKNLRERIERIRKGE